MQLSPLSQRQVIFALLQDLSGVPQTFIDAEQAGRIVSKRNGFARFSGRQKLQDQPLVLCAQHRPHPHLANHCACFAGRQILGRVMASPAICAEALFAFRALIYFSRG
jgi:hypothetical protein